MARVKATVRWLDPLRAAKERKEGRTDGSSELANCGESWSAVHTIRVIKAKAPEQL